MALAAIGSVWLAQQRERSLIDSGRALFHGEQGLPARVAGHDTPLPVAASRCINCHGAQAAGSAPVTVLSAATLAEPVARRGGPPSRYDARSLCTLLRRGVDPAHVMLPRAMPRFDIDDLQCEALWQYLTNR